MTLDDSVHAYRLRVMARAHALGNVTRACEEAGISRTLFYRWRRRYTAYGAPGLHPRRHGPRRQAQEHPQPDDLLMPLREPGQGRHGRAPLLAFLQLRLDGGRIVRMGLGRFEWQDGDLRAIAVHDEVPRHFVQERGKRGSPFLVFPDGLEALHEDHFRQILGIPLRIDT